MEVRGGRTSDLAVTADGRYFDNMALCGVFENLGSSGIRQYRVVQETHDRFSVLLAAARDERLAAAIRHGFRPIVGPAVIDVQFVDEIPRDPSGKLRHFVSGVEKSHVPVLARGAGA
jgi:hypothetical protein